VSASNEARLTSDYLTKALLYKENEDWTSLRLMLNNNDPVSYKGARHLWAARPTTVNALAMSFLAQGANASNFRLVVQVKEMANELKAFIESPRPDLRDHSILFLVFTIEQVSSEVKGELVRTGVFGALIPLIRHDLSDLSQAAAYLCHEIYSNSKRRQAAFIAKDGHLSLIMLIERDCTTARLSEWLVYVQDLMVVEKDRQCTDVQEHIAHMKTTELVDVLRVAGGVTVDEDSQDLIQELTLLLAR
jgi:hypothetical protein